MIGPFDQESSNEEIVDAETRLRTFTHTFLGKPEPTRHELPPWQRTSFVGYQEWLRSEIHTSIQSGVQTGIELGVNLALDQNRMKMEKEIESIDTTITNNIDNVNKRINKVETNINRMREEIGIIGAELHSDSAIMQNRMDTLESEVQEIKTLLLRQQNAMQQSNSSYLSNCQIM